MISGLDVGHSEASPGGQVESLFDLRQASICSDEEFITNCPRSWLCQKSWTGGVSLGAGVTRSQVLSFAPLNWTKATKSDARFGWIYSSSKLMIP
jgi:hypothetical protein